MQIQGLGHKAKGFYRLWAYALRWGMEEETEAQRRYRILSFWRNHGLQATLDAFRVSRRTLFNWQSRLAGEGGNMAALASQSRASRHRRQRQWPASVLAEIRRLRKQHPNLGKEKIHVLLSAFCATRQLACPAPRTIGRIISDAQDKMRRTTIRLGARGQPRPARPQRLRKPKHFKAQFPGHCIALDTIERHRDGLRRDIITLTDTHTAASPLPWHRPPATAPPPAPSGNWPKRSSPTP